SASESRWSSRACSDSMRPKPLVSQNSVTASKVWVSLSSLLASAVSAMAAAPDGSSSHAAAQTLKRARSFSTRDRSAFLSSAVSRPFSNDNLTTEKYMKVTVAQSADQESKKL